MFAPQRERATAEAGDDRLRSLGLAIRGEHAAGPVARPAAQGRVAAVAERHGEAGVGEQERLPRARDARADNRDRLATPTREAGHADWCAVSRHAAPPLRTERRPAMRL